MNEQRNASCQDVTNYTKIFNLKILEKLFQIAWYFVSITVIFDFYLRFYGCYLYESANFSIITCDQKLFQWTTCNFKLTRRPKVSFFNYYPIACAITKNFTNKKSLFWFWTLVCMHKLGLSKKKSYLQDDIKCLRWNSKSPNVSSTLL